MPGTSCIAAGLLLGAALSGGASAQQAAPATPVTPAPPAAVATAAVVTGKPAGQGSAPAASLAGLQPNVLTIEALIKAENELALAQARRERQAAGLESELPAAGPKPRAPAAMSVQVESIAGPQGRLRTQLTANGQQFDDLGVGAKVHGCRIEAFEGRCVVFKPAGRSVRPQQCPTACWSGTRNEAPGAWPPVLPAGLPGGTMPAGPLPGAAGASLSRPPVTAGGAAANGMR